MNLFSQFIPPFLPARTILSTRDLHRTALLLPFNDKFIGKDNKVVSTISTEDKNQIVDPQYRVLNFI